MKNKIKRMVSMLVILTLIVCNISTIAYAKTDFKTGVAIVTGSNLRLRTGASLFSSVIDYAEKGDFVVVIDKIGDWYKVNYNLQDGYMHKNYLSFTSKENVELGYGRVCGTDVNMRTGPSIGFKSINMLNAEDLVYIIGINDGWYKVIFNNTIGYIRSDYVELTEVPYENYDSNIEPLFFRNGKRISDFIDTSLVKTNDFDKEENNIKLENTPVVSDPDPALEEKSENETTDEKKAENDNEDSVGYIENEPLTSSDSNIVEIAEKYLGTPYLWGGMSPDGFDCSGLVCYVFKSAGYSIPRTSSMQYLAGTPVEKENLQCGDLVFFQNTYTTGISHVGIYVGDGKFIHSPSTGKVVSYADLNSAYYESHYYGACRIAK